MSLFQMSADGHHGRDLLDGGDLGQSETSPCGSGPGGVQCPDEQVEASQPTPAGRRLEALEPYPPRRTDHRRRAAVAADLSGCDGSSPPRRRHDAEAVLRSARRSSTGWSSASRGPASGPPL
jgi:hypothetical protein